MKKKWIFILYFLLTTNSCELKPDCDSNKKFNLSNECIAVALVKPTHSDVFLEKGYNPYTQEICKCKEYDRWMRIFYKEIDVGDTIIKKRGELFFQIRKSDTIITHKWKCSNK
ncbi:hypothetical protein BA768_18930 [Chryseobacterium sp. CBo1]|uniref:hypothetical protein n=1 Tax=Chryseobacterium sp. CBo1 TaxID=1869230 RepID=UPI000810C6D0|nr:hypothetical protein [Chryseobacterium sp. CBo1]OCK50791.1 hypothetical protein BA768_18930 [Chryseobacterium sp. CBo1]